MKELTLTQCIELYGQVFGPIRYNEQYASIEDVYTDICEGY